MAVDLAKVTEALARMGRVIGSVVTVTGAINSVYEQTKNKMLGLASGLLSVFQASSSLGVLTGMVGSLGAAVGAVIGPIASLATSLIGMGAAANILTGLFNPAIAKQFSLAVGDLLATFGEVLQPIVQAVIPLIRQLGDILATMGPVFKPLTDIFIQFVGILRGLLIPVASVLTPLITLLAQVLQGLMPIIVTIANFIGGLAAALVPIIELMSAVVTNLLVAFEPLMGLFNEIAQILLTVLVPILSVMTTIIAVVSSLFAALTPIIKVIADVVGFVGRVIGTVIAFIMDAINWLIRNMPLVPDEWQIKTKKFSELDPKSSMGKKVLSTSRMSAEDLGAKARESVFGGSINWVSTMEDVKKLLREQAFIMLKMQELLAKREGLPAFDKIRDKFTEEKIAPLAERLGEIARELARLRKGAEGGGV